MPARPFLNNVLLKQIDTKGEIILPDEAFQGIIYGEVISTSPSNFLLDGVVITEQLLKGDKVYFRKNSADKINVDGQEFYLTNFLNVLAVDE